MGCPTCSNCKTQEAVASARDERATAEWLLSAAAVRARSAILVAAAERGDTRHFRLVPSRLDDAVRRVVDTTLRRYPDLDVPCHSRWRHFSTGGVDRAAFVAPGAGMAMAARARIDLAVVSVLLDAGAGPSWRYYETETGQTLDRSEGLAVASLRAMQAGLFSADPRDPWRADAAALAAITPVRLAEALQHGPGNELIGLEDRAQLLRRLGEVCAADPTRFGRAARPGGLYDYWHRRGEVWRAADILRTLLLAFGRIWPGGASLGGMPLGDCAWHSLIPADGLVPFHKLSQWLAYSLVEPLRAGGIEVVELDELTGLAEYRNGGLFFDCGVIEACDPRLPRRPLMARSEPVVEWRALTIILLDRLARNVRRQLGQSAAAFPLTKVLEGGSWAAGREIASERRASGAAPLAIVGGSTLF
jgi:Protein of unknown function (DUF1688)